MLKVIVTTVLDPDIKSKFAQHSKATYIPYRKLIEYAFNNFVKKVNKSNDYKLKHIDFERIKTSSFTSSIPTDLNEKLIDYAKKFQISKRMLIREIITDFVKSL